MKPFRLSAWTLAGAAGLLVTLPNPALGQGVLKPFRADDGKPVMRAQPVRPPQPIPAEPLAGEQAVPAPAPAPIPEEAPVAPAAPVRRAPAATAPKARPVTTETAPPPQPKAPAPADPGEIRVSPVTGARSPDQVQLDVADGYYAKKMFQMAAPEYQRYLDLFPGAAGTPTALYRLAESYREAGSSNAAKIYYDQLLVSHPGSDFVGPAAFRLADMYYQDRNYVVALPLFRKASVRLKEPDVVSAAKFYTGRCLEATGQKLDARMMYEDLVLTKEPHPYQDASRFSYAMLLKDSGRTVEALRQMQTLAKQAQSDELKAEAMVRAGLWQLEGDQPGRAADELKQALEMPGGERWKEVAQLGLMKVHLRTGKYKELVEAYESGLVFEGDTQADFLTMVAGAMRQLNKMEQALELYDRVVKTYPKTSYAREAGYERLVCMYNTDQPQLVEEIDVYLAKHPDTERRDQTLLMKAETLYKRGDRTAAAPLYSAVAASRQLPSALRAEANLKIGICAMEARDFERAVQAFTAVGEEAPTNKNVPYAIVQRATAYVGLKNLTAAEKDFDTVIRKYPNARARELALEQKAMIRGQQDDNKGMSAAFDDLLTSFPKSSAAPKAHFWIGWSAFEERNHQKAIVHLLKARELDREQYFERATLRLLLAYHALEDRQGVARELELYNKEGKTKPPIDVLRWLTEELFHDRAYESAEKYLAMLAPRDEALPRDLLRLAQARLYLKKYAEAASTLEERYLKAVQEPPSRATGLLELAKARTGLGNFPAAQKAVDEALLLQPEGRISGEARIAAGDILVARGQHSEAARTYASVAVLLDDEEVTPRALEKAVTAYERAGQEQDARKTLNQLQSRYPEYAQAKKSASSQ